MYVVNKKKKGLETISKIVSSPFFFFLRGGTFICQWHGTWIYIYIYNNNQFATFNIKKKQTAFGYSYFLFFFFFVDTC